MKRELDGMVGTEWQVADANVAADFDLSLQLNPTKKAEEVKKWVDEYEGVGRVYIDTMFGQYYFEDEGDRMMFTLRWA